MGTKGKKEKKIVKGKPMLINLEKGMNADEEVKKCSLSCKKYCNDPAYPCPIKMLGRMFG